MILDIKAVKLDSEWKTMLEQDLLFETSKEVISGILKVVEEDEGRLVVEDED